MEIFLKDQDVPTEFIHRDEFYGEYSRKDLLPAVFLKENSELDLFISKKEIDSCKSLEELISLIKKI